MREEGFTLIEALVALAVLAISAAALIGASELNTSRIYELETRTTARLVAEEVLAEMQVVGGVSEAPQTMRMLSREWTIDTEMSATDDPDIGEVELVVFAGDDDEPSARFTGFVDLDATGRERTP